MVLVQPQAKRDECMYDSDERGPVGKKSPCLATEFFFSFSSFPFLRTALCAVSVRIILRVALPGECIRRASNFVGQRWSTNSRNRGWTRIYIVYEWRILCYAAFGWTQSSISNGGGWGWGRMLRRAGVTLWGLSRIWHPNLSLDHQAPAIHIRIPGFTNAKPLRSRSRRLLPPSPRESLPNRALALDFHPLWATIYKTLPSYSVNKYI